MLIVCALESETNGQLGGYDVLYTGVGKINATFSLTRRFIEFGFPKLVINYGTAGSRQMPIGELVECHKFIQRDMDASLLGFPIGITPFDNTPLLLGSKDEGIIVGTGDSFVTNISNEIKDIDVFDMESYSLAKVCSKFNIPFKCWKYITDNADGSSPNKWEENQSDGIIKFKDILNAIK